MVDEFLDCVSVELEFQWNLIESTIAEGKEVLVVDAIWDHGVLGSPIRQLGEIS